MGSTSPRARSVLAVPLPEPPAIPAELVLLSPPPKGQMHEVGRATNPAGGGCGRNTTFIEHLLGTGVAPATCCSLSCEETEEARSLSEAQREPRGTAEGGLTPSWALEALMDELFLIAALTLDRQR